jgi:hypothetical protein
MDDIDVGKPRLPWTVAGDGVGRACGREQTTATVDGVGPRRARGRGQRPWARALGGAAAVRAAWARGGVGGGVGPAAWGGVGWVRGAGSTAAWAARLR